jgi:hypothetical protein
MGREVLSSEFWVLSLSLIRKPRRARAAGEVRGGAELGMVNVELSELEEAAG